jgi:hypothetical protein
MRTMRPMHLKSDEERTIRLQPGNGASDAACKRPLFLAKMLASFEISGYAEASNIVRDLKVSVLTSRSFGMDTICGALKFAPKPSL